jgi:hypothetical protein
MKAGINIWRALRDIKDVHPAWACVAEQRYTEADLPRPITRKEDVGTLTGTKEFDERQVRRCVDLVGVFLRALRAKTTAGVLVAPGNWLVCCW